MTCIITPVVGDKLWYIADRSDRQEGMKVAFDGCGIDQPLDATVVAVWDDRLVSLVVLDSIGRSFVRKGVVLLQEGDKPRFEPFSVHPVGHAVWKPAQRAHAILSAANDAATAASVGQVASIGGSPANGGGPLAA